MLGLGLGLGRTKAASTEVLIYSSDFTSSVNGWALYTVPAGTTITFNQTAPDTSTGWLLQTFGAEETNNGGMSRTAAVPSDAQGATAWRITGKVYFEETSAEWGGAITAWRIQFADAATTRDFAVNQAIDFSVTKSGVSPMASSELAFLYGAGNVTTIASGAKVYYKDLKIYAVL